jgi:orotidine-5'-phosphate decarboxylase
MERLPPLVVALDFPAKGPALDLGRRLVGRVAFVKVGLQLFVAEGPQVLAELRQMGHLVFADLKLHDIPNTVAGAVASAGGAGASLLTVHACGGPAMLKAAVEAAGSYDLRLLGVTVLTSVDQATLAETGVAGHLVDQVMRLAVLAHSAGLNGCVASPQEASLLRAAHPEPFLIVTPGVRPVWDAGTGDQVRVATPRQAILTGADLVVVGRPITGAADPVEAAERIGEELVAALRERGRPRPFGEALEDGGRD